MRLPVEPLTPFPLQTASRTRTAGRGAVFSGSARPRAVLAAFVALAGLLSDRATDAPCAPPCAGYGLAPLPTAAPSVGRLSHDRAGDGPPCGPATGWSCQEGQASPACAPCAPVHGGNRRRLKPCAWLSRSASGRPIASSASHAQSTAPARLRATRRPPSKVQSAFMLKPSMPGTFPRIKVASRRRQRAQLAHEKKRPGREEAEAWKSCGGIREENARLVLQPVAIIGLAGPA